MNVDQRNGLGLPLRVLAGSIPKPEGRRGSVWRDAEGRQSGYAIVGRSSRWLVWEDLGLFEIESLPAINGWPLPGIPRETFVERFRADVQPVLLQALGWETLHGSAVLTPAGALVICGRSGAGKSTLSYALARAGCTQLSDDQVVLEFKDQAPFMRPQPFVPSLRPASAAHFGGQVQQPGLTGAWVPLAGIVLLDQIADLPQPVSATRIQAARAFSELLPHAHCFDPHDENASARLVDHYLSIAQQTPVHAVSYRPSFALLDVLVSAVQTLAGVSEAVLIA